MRRFIELSHALQNGMEAYPGLPPVKLSPIFDHESSRERYEGKAEFYLGMIEMAMNTSTYLDSPFHRFRNGKDLSELPIERLADLYGIVIDGVIGADRGVSASVALPKINKDRPCAALIRTGHDRHWQTEVYNASGPHLSRQLVDALIDADVALVGVDFLNVDDTKDPSRPVHTRLLEREIAIVENLTNLKDLHGSGFRFFAIPLKIVRGASFPVRAFALIDR